MCCSARPLLFRLTSLPFHFFSLILVYLITASLPLGYFPQPEMLEAFDLQGQYEGLIRALKVRPVHSSVLIAETSS